MLITSHLCVSSASLPVTKVIYNVYILLGIIGLLLGTAITIKIVDIGLLVIITTAPHSRV